MLEETEYKYKREIERLRDTHNDALKASRVASEEARVAYEDKEVQLIAQQGAELTRIKRESENKIATLELKITRIEEAYKSRFEEASRQYKEQVKNIQAEADVKVSIEKIKTKTDADAAIMAAKVDSLIGKEQAINDGLRYYEEKLENINNMYSSFIENLTDIIEERTNIDVVELIKNLPQPIAKANATSTSTSTSTKK